MDKIWLIIQREYLNRVRKKSFLVMSLLAPLLLAGTSLIIAKLNAPGSADEVAVYDESGLGLMSRLASTEEIRFVPAAGASPTAATTAFKAAKPKQAALLVFSKGFSLDNTGGVRLLANGNMSLKRQLNIRKAVNKAVGELKLTRSGLSQTTIDNLKADVDLQAVNLADQNGRKNNAGLTTATAYVLSILVYMFIFIYGVQVMRGVAEEKSNRIMEVMVSSVKPFQLMMGKILGIGAVVLTQFGIWLALSYGITTLAAPLLMKPAKAPATTAVSATKAPAVTAATAASGGSDADAEMAPPQPGTTPNLWSMLEGLPIGSIIGGFLFFFLGGYLLYSALFAAIGAAVDDQTDAQQFMFPVTIPLILSYIASITVVINGDPNGPLAFWLSMIPFTSPIAMVMRLPFGVPLWQLLLSGAILVGGFILTTWIAGRIYRVGILMYGKKVTYAELSRWMFYKG
ncbi:ABC transporter permease [Hymenobacter cellulosivorans]|uniref:ABC transporter permease n=1 Tax=Hymenobacter cellulosivorans TaxID=2932249 RepID=A0ABY4FGV0_9BACT|nr:ABC transporter permease [Hymenobacter cellulosivorans]UOQ55199.1 ABC transporter permease [Hymenobacter cellulosivorans]